MNTQQIVYINTEKIYPHPHNPRKNLGDLTEMSESIKATGILQPLTVVPFLDEENNFVADKYITVIGHRRHAGAKLAGLNELPCIISDMDETTQLSTMLLENMQRSDLTTLEEAEGFQMMLDLGVSVADLSQKTGFSESTVRRRVKLLELDREKLEKSVERGASLNDYLELDKITDQELKNKVLDAIGTSNFNFELQNAISTEQKRLKRIAFIEFLDTFATKVETKEGLMIVRTYYDYSDLTKLEGHEEYFYFIDTYCISVYAKAVERDNSEQEKWQEKNNQDNMRREQLNYLAQTAYNLRKEFVKSCSTTTIRKNLCAVVEFLAEEMINGLSLDCDNDLLGEFLEIEIDEDLSGDGFSFEQVRENYFKSPEILLLAVVYSSDADREKLSYHTWYCCYYKNATLNRLYTLLQKLGYQMSDEEKELQNGTHSLFKHENE